MSRAQLELELGDVELVADHAERMMRGRYHDLAVQLGELRAGEVARVEHLEAIEAALDAFPHAMAAEPLERRRYLLAVWLVEHVAGLERFDEVPA